MKFSSSTLKTRFNLSKYCTWVYQHESKNMHCLECFILHLKHFSLSAGQKISELSKDCNGTELLVLVNICVEGCWSGTDFCGLGIGILKNCLKTLEVLLPHHRQNCYENVSGYINYGSSWFLPFSFGNGERKELVSFPFQAKLACSELEGQQAWRMFQACDKSACIFIKK